MLLVKTYIMLYVEVYVIRITLVSMQFGILAILYSVRGSKNNFVSLKRGTSDDDQ
jgi:hypothetical protein